ncbi:arginine decarboxylase, pyruvoyl-dependent [Candidatus Woesearchaeota archaeon]|nr:arginine decarboxylase, pyruvoyl-dependent [Candidatus Woesearchaeota archaeon]
MTPRKFFLTSGVGTHKDYLASFELALRDAGLAPFNLVSVSSILPPGCKKITWQEGLKQLNPGEVVFVVLARNATNEPNRLIAASVGCAIPANRKKYGYLSEHHPFGETREKAGDYAEDLAASMLATTLGLKFNPDDAWDSRRQAFRLSSKIVRTTNVTQTARGDKYGRWTSVVSAAVFIP